MKRTFALLSLVFALTVSGAARADEHDDAHKHAELPKEAVAVLFPTKGYDVKGVVVMKQMGEDVHLQGKVMGLTPGGKHGFHIHEFGDLRSADGTSAGGHYNPEGHKHGGLEDEERHAGDLGNLTADGQGVATVDVRAKGLKLHFVIGRALIVHAKEDDLKSQPTGDAGPRAALGVIGFAEVKKE